MSADVVTFPGGAAAADDIEIPLDEMELPIEPEIELALEPEPSTAVVALGLVEILPADFQLPLLTKFIPNPALKTAVATAASQALAIEVTGAEGLQRADVALTQVRAAVKAIDEHFAEPTRVANELHKRLTGIRGEWQAEGKSAIESVGRRVVTESRRLEQLAADERRRQQQEADRIAREDAARAAREAEQSQAPKEVVEEMKRVAETVTAPPVAAPPPVVSTAMRNSTTVKTWKARLVGTPGSDDPNPSMDALTVAQRHQVLELLKAVIDGKAPLTVVDLNWSYLNARAKSDKGAMAIPGVEAFEQGSVRAKSTRG